MFNHRQHEQVHLIKRLKFVVFWRAVWKHLHGRVATASAKTTPAGFHRQWNDADSPHRPLTRCSGQLFWLFMTERKSHRVEKRTPIAAGQRLTDSPRHRLSSECRLTPSDNLASQRAFARIFHAGSVSSSLIIDPGRCIAGLLGRRIFYPRFIAAMALCK